MPSLPHTVRGACGHDCPDTCGWVARHLLQRSRRGALASLVLLVAVAGVSRVLGQTPVFRTGVDLARLDVTVLDSRTRQPVRGLKAEDFVLAIGGQARPVTALTETEVASSPMAGAVATGDVATNEAVRGRLFIIVMDDAVATNDPYQRDVGKKIARATVDKLGPDDRAAVVFAQSNSNAVGFTANRTDLYRAIDTYQPRHLNPGLAVQMSMSVLRRSRKFLAEMPGYRRAVVWITAGVPGGRLQPVSGVPIYAFHTLGLAPFSREIAAGERPNRTGDALRSIAAQSDGEAYVDTNAPEAKVAEVFRQLASYYTLGFTLDGLKDGAPISLKVARPGVEIHLGQSTCCADVTSHKPAPSAAGVASRAAIELFEALSGPLPDGDLPLTMSAAPFSAGLESAALITTVGITPPTNAKAGDSYDLQLLVFEGDGSEEVHRQSQSIRASTAGPFEVLLRVPLRPGRYYLRLAVRHDATRTAGSVYAPSVVVPEFRKAPLSASGLVVGLAEGKPAGGRQTLDGLLDFPPTTTRTFASTDHVGALLRVYQRAETSRLDARVEMTILDSAGTPVVNSSQEIAGSAFVTGAADVRYEVPLATLSPGSFLLRVIVTAGKERVERSVTFHVRR